MNLLTIVVVLGCIVTVAGIVALVMRDTGTTGLVESEDLDEGKVTAKQDKENFKLR